MLSKSPSLMKYKVFVTHLFRQDQNLIWGECS